MDAKTLHKELIKCFFLAFKRLSLYAVEHPLSKEILESLFKMFDTLLRETPEILMVVGAGTNEMIVGEQRVSAETLGVAEIYEKFKLLKLDGVSFGRGLPPEELVAFVKAMASAASHDAGKVIEIPRVLREGSAHIKIRKIHYEKVEEGQVVVGQEEPAFGSEGPGGAGPGAGPGGGAGADQKARILSDIKNFLSGRESGIGTRAEEVLEHLEHDVSGVAQAIIESAKESGDFETVIRRLVAWISEHMVPILVERKRDPSKFIQRIFDSFKKEEGVRYFPGAGDIIASAADDIMVAMSLEAYEAYKASPKKGLTLAAKILADEDDQKRVLPKLKQRLLVNGVAALDVDNFLQSLEAELAKDEEVSVSKKRLAKLTRLAERFDEEVASRVRQATESLVKENKRLADEKERSEGVMRYIADGLVVVDKAGNIVMMNPAAEKMLNTATKEAIGKSLAESIKDEHLLAMAKGTLDDKDETRITKEIELACKDEATKKVLKASSAVVENEDGKPVGMVAVLSDITRQKEVDEMKAHFVSLVTHELRTPVVAIQKSLELILSKATGAINEDQEKFLSMSRFNIERLNKLINDLLDVSRLESGKFTLNPSAFDIRDVANEAKNSLTSWANDKKIDVQLELPPEGVTVAADKDRMLQVLVNLIGNALKFTPQGGLVRMWVKPLDSRPGLCEGPCVEVGVEDNGIGIDPKDFKRIFNKFEQVSLVAPRGVGGSGLGLSIAKEIIGLHRGTIWVESELGKGSRFIFVIPREGN